MKKNLLLMAVVSVVALTACTSEDEVVQATSQTTQVADEAVGFDVYLPNSTQTRSGRTGVMTTTTMQKTGFGIFGYQSESAYTYGLVPNYMWNQQVNFNTEALGWYYAPLKYWPNETKNDSQTTPAEMPNIGGSNLDRLSFFAYAPWVKAAADGTSTTPVNSSIEATAENGIVYITHKDGTLYNGASFEGAANPKIKYKVATDPNQSVDLLWGVAPVGGLSYQNVSGAETKVAEGFPLIDLTKPAVNTTIKFMFQHALARLGVKVVAAVDQVAAGGTFDYGNSKITIEQIDIKGTGFRTEGVLNLNNTSKGKNVAKWETAGTTGTITIKDGQGLAPHLIYDATLATAKKQQEVTGVTTTLADAIKVSSTYDKNYPADYATEVKKPSYSATTPYFAKAEDLAEATNPYTAYKWTKAGDKNYLHKYTTNKGESYADITQTISTLYPKATFWENIYSIATSDLKEVWNDEARTTYKDKTAYRKIGSYSTDNVVFVPTGQKPEIGDYVFATDPQIVDPPKMEDENDKAFLAKPNYFMIIPTNEGALGDNKVKVKITYYVSTQDASLQDGIVYTKNEVEKEIELPHLKNGVAYNLKLILGLTSVKLEAEVADWETTYAEVNLPQNTAE